MSEENIPGALKEESGAAAQQVAAGKTASCKAAAELSCCDPITRDLHDAQQSDALAKETVPAACDCPPGCVDLPCCR
jgi:hypothetical protein